MRKTGEWKTTWYKNAKFKKCLQEKKKKTVNEVGAESTPTGGQQGG